VPPSSQALIALAWRDDHNALVALLHEQVFVSRYEHAGSTRYGGAEDWQVVRIATRGLIDCGGLYDLGMVAQESDDLVGLLGGHFERVKEMPSCFEHDVLGEDEMVRLEADRYERFA